MGVIKIDDIDEANRVIRVLLSDKNRLLSAISSLKTINQAVRDELTKLAEEVPYIQSTVNAIVHALSEGDFPNA